MHQAIDHYRTDRDAFGHELYDYFQDPEGEHYEIIERDDGFISASTDVRFYFLDYPDWPQLDRDALEDLLPGRTLDVGCGAGRMLLYLQSKGHDVVGIDSSPLAIEVCKQRGAKDVRLMPVERMRTGLGKFDNILMMGNNWGLLANPKKARRLLRRFGRISNPGARLIATTNDVYATDDMVHLNYHAWNRARGRMSGQIHIRVRHRIYKSKWFDYLMVSKEELESLLEGTGWRLLRYHDQPGASNYAVVLEKAKS